MKCRLFLRLLLIKGCNELLSCLLSFMKSFIDWQMSLRQNKLKMDRFIQIKRMSHSVKSKMDDCLLPKNRNSLIVTARKTKPIKDIHQSKKRGCPIIDQFYLFLSPINILTSLNNKGLKMMTDDKDARSSYVCIANYHII
jgi:hypothetical protein